MVSLYRITGKTAPERIEFFEKMPKISSKFKAEIKERHGSGAFFLWNFDRKAPKVHFVIDGILKTNQTEENNMDLTTIMQLAQALGRIEQKQDRILKAIEDFFDDTETESEPAKPENPALAALMANLATNPEMKKALDQFGGIEGLKALGGL